MEDILGLFFILMLVAIAVMAALAITALAGAAAASCVFGAATHGFGTTMWRGIVHRGGDAAQQGPGEPAFRAYYRGQLWADLKIAAGTGWQRAVAETARVQALVPPSSEWYVAVFRGFLLVYGYIGLVVGALAGALLGLIPALIITLFAGGAWAVGVPLRTLEQLRRKRQGTHFDCPECHDRFALPVYVCPVCSARHRELAPGPFGVLRHRCTCGSQLPAVQWRGRESLTSECPAHGHPLGEGVGTVRTFHVPVAGGPATGKSTFLAAVMVGLEEAVASGAFSTAVQSSSRDGYNRLLDGFRRGVLPSKTVDMQAPALVAEVRGKDKSALLYAYDVAGEAYGDEHELRSDPGYGLAEGVVLLIDPFALERVRADLGDELAATPEMGVSREPPQRVLERLAGILDEKGIDLARVPAAVCITKCDALDIGATIDATEGRDDDARVQAWLHRQGAGNLLRAAQETFKEVRCFSTTALGRTPGTGSGPFVPAGTLEPMLWLLATAGVTPAATGEAQETTTERLRTAAPLDVTPRRPLFAGAINAVTPWPLAGNFAVGLLAFGALWIAVSSAGALKPSGGADPVAGAAPDGGAAVTDTLENYAAATRDKDYQTICDDIYASELVQRVRAAGLPCAVALRTGLEDRENPRLEVLGVEVNGGQALARVRVTADGELPSTEVVRLAMEDGNWRVASLSAPGPALSGPPARVPPSSAPTPDPEEGTAYETSAYALTVPDGWIRNRDEKQYDGYIESRWHLAGQPQVSFNVDYTLGFDGTPAEGARSVRKLYPGHVSSYEELDWSSTVISGHNAWRWRFRVGDRDVESIDWFFSECSTGIAMLGAAPPDEFEDHLPTFKAAAESLTFPCE